MTRTFLPKHKILVILVVVVLAIATLIDRTRGNDQARPLSAVVIRVGDGDSLTVTNGTEESEVRLFGIDAPEMGQDFGDRSRREAIELARGREVTLKPRGRDQYDRLLADVILPDGRNLNHEMVKRGMAWWYRKYARDDVTLERYQHIASASELGLWALPDPTPPWEYRRTKRNDD